MVSEPSIQKDRLFNPWKFPLVPFWALSYVLSKVSLSLQEDNWALKCQEIKAVIHHQVSFIFGQSLKVPIFLVRGILLGVWGLLKRLWSTLRIISFFVHFVITGSPKFVRDCRYFVGKCVFPKWDGKDLEIHYNTNWAELKRPLGINAEGFLLIGRLAFVIKVVHLPLKEILVLLMFFLQAKLWRPI
jgi:hypothetical protein